MKSEIKKLEHYPVTLLEAVYRSGTNENLKEVLKEYDNILSEIPKLQKKILSYESKNEKLVNFKGEFTDAMQQLARSGEVGDYYMYSGTQRLNVDGGIIEPNSYVYVDIADYKGEPTKILKSIHIKYKTAFEKKNRYDVVIVGAGAGGIGAAYALKDSGLNVALVERLDTLGGTHCNAGVGLMIATPVGDWYKNICQEAYNEGMMDFRAVTTNKYKEVGAGTTFEKRWRGALFSDEKNVINGYKGNHININDVWFGTKYFTDLKENIDIFLNHEVIGTKADNNEIYEIECIDLITGERTSIVGDYFIDCSADAVLFTQNTGLTYGTDYYSGTDGAARFSESAYRENEEPNIYGINTVEPVYFSVANTYANGYIVPDPPHLKEYSEVEYRANYDYIPPGADQNIKMCSRSYGTHMSTEHFLKRTREWNYADGYARAAWLNLKDFNTEGVRLTYFAGICKMLAIRESYRVACEKTVDQTYLGLKITSDNLQSEKIMALSTWYVDIHNQSYSAISNICNGIPYEAMIPKCYKNVLVASRCYGASHIGLSSVRLVKTMLDLGYSAGKAMKQAVEEQIEVRNVDTQTVQQETGIATTMREIETYFYGSSVDYSEIS